MDTPAAALLERALAAPAAWGPLLALLLRDQSRRIMHAAYVAWLHVPARLPYLVQGTQTM